MGDLFFSIASQYSVATYQLAAENGMTIWSRLVLGGTSDVSGTATASIVDEAVVSDASALS